MCDIMHIYMYLSFFPCISRLVHVLDIVFIHPSITETERTSEVGQTNTKSRVSCTHSPQGSPPIVGLHA